MCKYVKGNPKGFYLECEAKQLLMTLGCNWECGTTVTNQGPQTLECPYQSPKVNIVNNKQDIVKNRKLLRQQTFQFPGCIQR